METLYVTKKNAKEKQNKDAKRLEESRVMTPLYSTAARPRAETQGDLPSSKTHYSQKNSCTLWIPFKNQGHAFYVRYGKSDRPVNIQSFITQGRNIVHNENIYRSNCLAR